MCSTNTSGTAMLPFGMKLAGQSPYIPLGSSHLSLELQRAQLQDYTQRLQIGMRTYPTQVTGLNPLPYHNHLANPYLHPYFFKDPRARFIHEEPKPNHSYIGLIAMAILSSRDKKLVLSDIYQWILDNYSYFRTRGPGWRNSIRHNLSLNDCFIKSGRSANGKGHYWAIHPANIDDFQKGDFRRRRAQRRVRKHMGLSVPEDEEDDSPMPSPSSSQPQTLGWNSELNDDNHEKSDNTESNDSHDDPIKRAIHSDVLVHPNDLRTDVVRQPLAKRAKRMFDMESLLAPDIDEKSEDVEVHDNKSESCDSLDKEHASDLSMNEGVESPKKTDLVVDGEKAEVKNCDNNASPVYTLENDGKHSLGVPLANTAALPNMAAIPGLRKAVDFRERVSAFRSANQYMWPSFGGYLSNYQLMSLSSNQMQQFLPNASVNSESVERWRQTMANIISQNQSKEDTRVLNVEDE